MKIKVLHIIGGPYTNGAYKGANILHNALLELNIESKILNDRPDKINPSAIGDRDNNIVYINNNFFTRLINIIFINLEKILKTIYLPSPRGTFTLGLFGFDITKIKEYKDADIIHIHWLSQGFINLKSLSKINKPVVWTMRDMWAFTGGSHYTMEFEKYEKSFLSKIIQNYKKKSYTKNFHFIAQSDWLRNKAQKSNVLKEFSVKRIYNNIDLKSFDSIKKEDARSFLKISTKKQIILFGADNPQSKRKGWDIFVDSLKKLDRSKYYLLIFGNFWSQKTLDETGIEYKSLGFINDKKILNNTYSCADLFVASSIQDSMPKTFAEAMSCQTPVVCFDNTSLSEIVDHKINGYVVENFDSDQLKVGINWLSEEIKKDTYSKNSARTKAENFSSEISAKKYIDLYKNILNKKSD